MELDSGVCGICDSKNEIINPKDAGAFWETICGIFKDQFDKKLIEQSQLKICLPCIFHANLINTKKHILKKIISNIDSAVNNKCRFCKTNSNLLKVQNSAIFKNSKFCQPSKGCSVICACCYYVIKANYVLKTNLLNNLSDCSTSTLKDSLHSIKTERCSDDDSSTFTKSKKNVVDGSKEGVGEILIHSDISIEKNISDADMKLPNKPNCKKKRNKRSKEKVEDAKLLSITSENKKTRKRKFSSSSNKDSSQQVKKACMQINNVNDLDMSKVRCLMPLCKTTVVVNEAIKQDAKFYNSVPYVQVPIIIKTEKHCSESPEHITKKKPLTEHITKKKSEQMLKKRPVSPIGIIKRTPPIKIKLKKITKLKKGIMEKKQNTKNLTQDKPSTNTIMFDEFKRKEVVVKVERMILPKDQKEPEPQLENTESETSVVAYESVLKNSSIREETPKKKKKVHFNDTPTIIITADELSEDSTNEEEDISTKKIIKNGKILKFEEEPTEEEYSFKINSDDSEDEIALTIQDDPTGGKIKIYVKEETKISPDKENDTTEIMDIDSSESESEELGDIVEGNKSKSVEGVMQTPQNEEENIELTAIDVSSEEPEQLPSSPSQLNDQGDSITPCKESGDETIELENSIISEECQSNIGEVNVIVKNIQAKEKNLNQEDSSVEESMEIQEKGSEIEDKNENEEKISIKKISTVGKSSLEETEFTVIEDSDNEIPEEGSEIEDKNENEEKISIKKISTVGKSSLEETESTVIEDSDDEIQEEGSEIEDKNENEEKISIKKISTVRKSSLEETQFTVIEDSDIEIPEEGSEIDDKNENEEKISIKKISTVGKSSLEETESTVIEDSDNEIPDEITSVQVISEKKAESELENTEKVSKTANIEEIESTENVLETDNVEEVEKKQDNELDAAKIVVNDVVLSEATTASEDFGSLIDEVQKCLTNKDEVTEDVLEMNDSDDETEKDDNLLSCLNDLE